MGDKKVKAWQDSPSTATPITAAELIRMESRCRDLRWHCPASWTSIDEFDDDTRDAAWAEVYPAGRSAAVAWTELGDIQSAALAGGGAAGDLTSLVRPLSGAGGATINNGDAFIVAMNVVGDVNTNYTMGGIVLADGATQGAGNQLVALYYTSNPLNLASTSSLWSWTGYNTQTNLSADTPPFTAYESYVYLRLVRISATTWRTDFSPNGVSWFLGTVGTRTITPTHVGLVATPFGSSTRGFVSFEFLRRVSGVS